MGGIGAVVSSAGEYINTGSAGDAFEVLAFDGLGSAAGAFIGGGVQGVAAKGLIAATVGFYLNNDAQSAN